MSEIQDRIRKRSRVEHVAAFDELAARLGVRTVRELDELLDNGQPESILSDASGLAGTVGDRRSTVPRLVRLLTDTGSDGVRCEVSKALFRLGGQNVFRRLAPVALEHADPRVRQWATYALAMGVGFNRREAADLMLFIFLRQEEGPLVRAQAAEGIASHASRRRRFVPHLVAALSDPSADVRFWACFALAELGGEAEIPALERLVEDRAVPEEWTWSVGAEARWAIGAIRARIAGAAEPEFPEPGEI